MLVCIYLLPAVLRGLLRAFSVETLVAVRDDDAGRAFGDALSTRAKFLLPTA